ncbi:MULTISPECIES: hypothetical protein [unclassified Shewanella]|uniref:hypothetical protein n=1 Tax=Shewanella TaxID=22 RepID=UPI0021DADE3D|nr:MULTISPECIES: hypothetical protein [unclassified Shewanella]MCU8015001.1 hypothetical protein [Shewanella sp. SM74]MCU8056242.1 hypothetical protein [Shewanella sp. SM35]MCU8065176.1 hypothetical protein [Shewanella sp. SM34]
MQNAKIVCITVLGCLLMLVSTGIGQFGQLMHTQTDVRAAALQQWADGDNERLMSVDEFTKACLIGGPIEQTNSEFKAPISIDECANLNGFDKLAEVVRKTDLTIKSYAWPLSLVAS